LVDPIRASLRPGLDLAGAVRANAVAAAAGLIQRSALLRQAQAGGRLRIEAAVFEIASGRVQLL
jgi:carbonic anhydrase